MSMENLLSICYPVIAHQGTIASATTVNGTVIDRQGYDDLLVACFTGTVTGTGVTINTKVQMDTVSGFGSPTDIVGAAFGQLDQDDDDVRRVGRVDLRKAERYIRPVITVAGTTPSVPIVVVFMLGSYTRQLREGVQYATGEIDFNVEAA